ncbi:hypothetical protein R1sor_020146 [Riccia sorocarpa]|uniref:MULE transposase domain-containing protein n=1 Tax=Riccia sorocarpa TaxID=122646 RepID=A0ABD3IKT3_9MARC
MAVSLKDVLNVQQSMRRYDPGHSADDAVATRNWTRLHPEMVVFYQERSQIQSKPFTLGWQTPWMLAKLVTLGHGSTVSMDATFGTNKYGFQLFTVLCFNAFQNDIPCLWILMERHEAADLVAVLSKVKERVNAYRLETLKTPDLWHPNWFLVDDAKEENIALRYVPVNLCLWHVRRAWLKKLHSLVKDPFQKAEMNRSLGQIIYCGIVDDKMPSYAGWISEVELLHRLGTKWGTNYGGVENIRTEWMNDGDDDCDLTQPVADLDIPAIAVSSESEDESDCVIVEVLGNSSTTTPSIRPLAHFEREVRKMYASVSHSTYLCSQAYEFLLQAVNHTHDLKATYEVHDIGKEDAGLCRQFIPVQGNDRTLKRKTDFLDKFHMKRRTQARNNTKTSNEWSEIDNDSKFQKMPSQNMSIQQTLDKVTHDVLDLNQSFTENSQSQTGGRHVISKTKGGRRSIQRKPLEVENLPPVVLVIE